MSARDSAFVIRMYSWPRSGRTLGFPPSPGSRSSYSHSPSSERAFAIRWVVVAIAKPGGFAHGDPHRLGPGRPAAGACGARRATDGRTIAPQLGSSPQWERRLNEQEARRGAWDGEPTRGLGAGAVVTPAQESSRPRTIRSAPPRRRYTTIHDRELKASARRAPGRAALASSLSAANAHAARTGALRGERFFFFLSCRWSRAGPSTERGPNERLTQTPSSSRPSRRGRAQRRYVRRQSLVRDRVRR